MLSVDFNKTIGSRQAIAYKQIAVPKFIFGFNECSKIEIRIFITNDEKVKLNGLPLFGFKIDNSQYLSKTIDLKSWTADRNIVLWFDPNTILDCEDNCERFEFQIDVYFYRNNGSREFQYSFKDEIIFERAIANLTEIAVEISRKEVVHSNDNATVISKVKVVFEKNAPIKSPEPYLSLLDNSDDLFLISDIKDIKIEPHRLICFYDILVNLSKIENPNQTISRKCRVQASYNGIEKEDSLELYIAPYIPIIRKCHFEAFEQFENGITFNNESTSIGTISLFYETKTNGADVSSILEFPKELNGLFYLDTNTPFVVNDEQNKFEFAVYADTSKISNPNAEKELYRLSLINILNESPFVIDLENICINRNDDKTKFNVQFFDSKTNEQLMIDGRESYNLGYIRCQDNEIIQSCDLIKIKITNPCELKDQGKLHFITPKITGIQNSPFSISELSDTFIIPNGSEKCNVFTLKLDYTQAGLNIGRMTFEIEFMYFEDALGVYSDQDTDIIKSQMPYKQIFTAVIQRAQSSNWTCVDFGTSAIVMINSENNIINLQEKQCRLLEINDREDAESFEQGTPFISSSMMFKNEEDPDSHNMIKNFYRFSPSISEVYEYPQYVSPPIKSIIGHENIYERFKDLKCTKNGIIQDVDFETMLTPKVVIEKVYSQFISDYMENIENVVFTYPNNFSKNKVEFIKKIYNSNLNLLEEPKSISESDAALLEYVASVRFDPRGKQSINILVYDMGAGTLDISYAKVLINDNNRIVKMLGRIGNNKGGNYLDYLIAQVLCNNDKRKIKLFIESISPNTCLFKEKIQEMKKEMIDIESESKLIDVRGEEFPYRIADILSNDLIEQYVKDCTVNIFEDLQYQFSDILKPDFVILTGRGSQFMPLQKAIIEELKIEDHNILRYEPNESKIIVSRGALQYAKLFAYNGFIQFEDKNLYSSFGIIYKNVYNQDDYLELLNPKMTPSKIHATQKIKKYEYQSKIYQVNFNNAAEIIFVQSYTTENKTYENYINKKENVRVIGKITNTGGRYGIVDICMSLDVQDNLECKIGNEKQLIQEKSLNISNIGEDFIGMMWPHWINSNNN